MSFEAITLGELREKTKDFPDDMPIYIDPESDECMSLLSIQQRTLSIYDPDSGEESEIEALVLGVA